MFEIRLTCHRSARSVIAGLALIWLGLSSPATAVLFVDSADPALNTAAPTDAYEDAGWQFLGYYGSFLGTAIAPQYFITAQHFGSQGTTFAQDALFTGGSTVNYSVDTSANGGDGYWDIAGTDLRIYKINETFANYAELYLGDATGQEALFAGRGGIRGDVILDGLNATIGWEHSLYDGVARWGTNQITGTANSDYGIMITATFDPSGSTAFEAGMSDGDSGGGMFVNDGGVWKLAGVNHGVDGLFDATSPPGDGNEFSASLFDMRGFYVGQGANWDLVPANLPDAQPSTLYFSSISANASAILAIISVPEPTGLVLAGVAALGWFARRRRL